MPIKRKPGRPKVGGRYTIQKHVFLDRETADLLKRLADKAELTESAYVRQLIRKGEQK